MTDYAALHDARVCAYHEAGHDVVAVDLGLPLTDVSIVELASSRGRAHLHRDLVAGYPSALLAVCVFGGPEAEKHFFEASPQRAALDYQLVRLLLVAEFGDDEVDRWARRCELAARAKIVIHQKWIARVAERLLLRQRLTVDEVAALASTDRP